jgi:uncharacterized protein YunC (DUF1805 family)
MTSKVIVRTISVGKNKPSAQGIEASWEGGQWVVIICTNGMVGCGAFDVKLMDDHDQVITVTPGTIERPLITCEDLMEAPIKSVTRLARKYGIKEGMSGREAVELLL